MGVASASDQRTCDPLRACAPSICTNYSLSLMLLVCLCAGRAIPEPTGLRRPEKGGLVSASENATKGTITYQVHHTYFKSSDLYHSVLLSNTFT